MEIRKQNVKRRRDMEGGCLEDWLGDRKIILRCTQKNAEI
jgi:hypothetical protein